MTHFIEEPPGEPSTVRKRDPRTALTNSTQSSLSNTSSGSGHREAQVMLSTLGTKEEPSKEEAPGAGGAHRRHITECRSQAVNGRVRRRRETEPNLVRPRQENSRTPRGFLPARGPGREQLPRRPWWVPGTGTQSGAGVSHSHRHTLAASSQHLCVAALLQKAPTRRERANLGFKET